MSMKAIVSIHDVMPSTLPHVQEILRELASVEGLTPERITLLVVPGGPWTEEGLTLLHEWSGMGYPFAGHGWIHEAVQKRTLFHRLHSALISRDAAEHLSRPTEELVELISNCHAWFGQNGLPEPTLYVPPAWAMGAVPKDRLQALPFRSYETLFGVYDSQNDGFTALPLAGFEADTGSRAAILRVVNGSNAALARLLRSPLRISIHPYDLQYRLAGALQVLLKRGLQFLDYGGL